MWYDLLKSPGKFFYSSRLLFWSYCQYNELILKWTGLVFLFLGILQETALEEYDRCWWLNINLGEERQWKLWSNSTILVMHILMFNTKKFSLVVVLIGILIDILSHVFYRIYSNIFIKWTLERMLGLPTLIAFDWL